MLKIFFTIIGIKLNGSDRKTRLGTFGNFDKVHHPFNTLQPFDSGVPVRRQILISQTNKLGEGCVLLHLININKVDEYEMMKNQIYHFLFIFIFKLENTNDDISFAHPFCLAFCHLFCSLFNNSAKSNSFP